MRNGKWLSKCVKCGSPSNLPRCDVSDDKLDFQVKFVQLMEDNTRHKIVENERIFGFISLGLALA